MKLITSTNKIKEGITPCKDGWGKLLKHLGKSKGDDNPLDIIDALDASSIIEVIPAMRLFNYKDYCLFYANIAEKYLLPILSEERVEAFRHTVDSIRLYYSGELTSEDLLILSKECLVEGGSYFESEEKFAALGISLAASPESPKGVYDLNVLGAIQRCYRDSDQLQGILDDIEAMFRETFQN